MAFTNTNKLWEYVRQHVTPKRIEIEIDAMAASTTLPTFEEQETIAIVPTDFKKKSTDSFTVHDSNYMCELVEIMSYGSIDSEPPPTISENLGRDTR